VERDVNDNVVVYEGCLFQGDLDPTDPLDIYWMDIDPAYQEKARNQGKMDDRVELGFFEKQFAYGANSRDYEDEPGKYRLDLAACPKLPVKLYYDAEFKQVVAETFLSGNRCQLQRIFVKTKQGTGGLTADWVELIGVDMRTSKTVSERMYHK
jgi:hypothetical protein